MNRTFGGPLALSVAGHCAALALLAVFAGHLPSPPPPLPAPRAIEILLPPPTPPTPVEPKPPPPPVPAVKQAPPPEPKPPPIVKEKPPPPPPRIVKEKPPPPPPRSRPEVTMRPPPAVRREPPPPELYREPPPVLYQPPVQYAAPAPPPQTASIPRAPAPAAPVVSSAYRNELYAWIQGHKYYPEEARQRGEAGAGVLRFRVDRAGRVLSYAVVRSTGYPDLDAAINRMMQGAQLPPFPADMTAANVEVSVTIRFALAQ